MAREADLLLALEQVVDPVSGRDIVSAGRTSGLVLRGGKAGLVLAVDGLPGAAIAVLEAGINAALRAVEGVEDVRVILTAERAQPPQSRPQSKPQSKPQSRPPQTDPHPAAPATLPEIGRIIAVASGKGGVGKSTVAVNLAVALAQRGCRTGLLDADIYGPSVPTLLGRHERAQLVAGRIQPIRTHGIVAVSMGTMADPDKAVVWRGPMASSAMMQMLTQTDWGQLDYLIIDLPPGTGDIQLTMAQKVPMTGAIIVSTPQDLALIDARKAMAMFGKVGVPVLGIVENMAAFACPRCGEVSHIFGHGGARKTSASSGVRFLGEVPLVMDIRESGDAGQPVVLGDSAAGAAFVAIADALVAALQETHENER